MHSHRWAYLGVSSGETNSIRFRIAGEEEGSHSVPTPRHRGQLICTLGEVGMRMAIE